MAEFVADFTPVKFKDKQGRTRTAYSPSDEVDYGFKGWKRVGGSGSPSAAFDPGEHTVADVHAYLEKASAAEQKRVMAAEADGKGRAGVAGWAAS